MLKYSTCLKFKRLISKQYGIVRFASCLHMLTQSLQILDDAESRVPSPKSSLSHYFEKLIYTCVQCAYVFNMYMDVALCLQVMRPHLDLITDVHRRTILQRYLAIHYMYTKPSPNSRPFIDPSKHDPPECPDILFTNHARF